MTTQKIELKRDGLTLRGLLELPDAEEFDIVVMLHGFQQDYGTDPADLKAVISPMLLEKGIAVLRMDFNGHGSSDGELKDMTVLNEVSDATVMLRYAKNLPGVRRVFLYGHSQGGVVASILAGYYPDVIDRVGLTSAAVTLKDDAIQGTCMGVQFDPKAIPDELNIRGLICGGHYFRTSQTLPITEWAANYPGPVLILHSKGDAIVNYVAAERLHAAFPNNQMFLFEGGNHSMKDDVREECIKKLMEFFTR